MADHRFAHEMNPEPGGQAALASEEDRLRLDLQNRVTKLNEQARIFIPLIAICVIVAMPIWSKSATKLLLLLMSPFVLLPIGFCLVHLAVACVGIARAKARIRDWEQVTRERKQLKS